MTMPAPGWHIDPTGRHQHRYWDGTTWTGDVADQGVPGIDPLGGVPSTQGHIPAGGGRRPTGLFVALGVAALVLLVGGALLVARGEDQGPDEEAREQAQSTVADGVRRGSGGRLSFAEADCIAGRMLDEIGFERLDEIGRSMMAGTSGSMPMTEDETAIVGAAFPACDAEDVLAEQIAVSLSQSDLRAATGGPLSEEQAECIGDGLVEEIGAERLYVTSARGIERGVSGLSLLDGDEAEVVDAVVSGCGGAV